jgi:hypothetical protein
MTFSSSSDFRTFYSWILFRVLSKVIVNNDEVSFQFLLPEIFSFLFFIPVVSPFLQNHPLLNSFSSRIIPFLSSTFKKIKYPDLFELLDFGLLTECLTFLQVLINKINVKMKFFLYY